MAAGYLTDTRFEFFKVREDSFMPLSSGGPSGHTNEDCKPSSHLALDTLHLSRLPSTKNTHKQ